MLEYIHLRNECPITYVYSPYVREMVWEVYTPWGEILTVSSHHQAERIRNVAILAWLTNKTISTEIKAGHSHVDVTAFEMVGD